MAKKIMIVTISILVAMFIGISFRYYHKEKAQENGVVAVGIEASKQKYFSNQLTRSFSDVKLLKKGDELIAIGKLNEAIEYLKNLLENNDSFELKGLAKNSLINAYEKARMYDKAYNTLFEDSKLYKIPPTHKFRIPVEERMIYLRYAADGEYDLAVKHAKLAMDADSILPTSNVKLFKQRLNDLIATKDYILSLKKNNAEN